MTQQPNSKGRQANEAEPLGDFTALGGKDKVTKTGEESRKRAGPDGPDATEVGDTFKGGPGSGDR
ncbi:hypothetical protein [Caulobacter endophyticus]|uniref:Uncharacterized protein n=1 Tax=Caulobacter endophyticus TaxID=2172652 RepID=A0A2T9JQD7_9CAUL|nr:hypothetical protein [Caulobacter endophyticus]PVM85919.1 hypothetical protein DDF67_17145 [Caulobacter endophyticus]